MMKLDNHGLEEGVALRYVTALGASWLYEEYDTPPLPQPTVMFAWASRPRGGPSVDYSALVAQSGLDLVMLEFAPGTERSGPWNIVIHVHREGRIDVLRECALWEGPTGRASVVVPTDADFCCGFDGASLRYCPFLPVEAELPEGFARAMVRMRLGVARLGKIQTKG